MHSVLTIQRKMGGLWGGVLQKAGRRPGAHVDVQWFSECLRSKNILCMFSRYKKKTCTAGKGCAGRQECPRPTFEHFNDKVEVTRCMYVLAW